MDDTVDSPWQGWDRNRDRRSDLTIFSAVISTVVSCAQPSGWNWLPPQSHRQTQGAGTLFLMHGGGKVGKSIILVNANTTLIVDSNDLLGIEAME